MLTEAEVLEKKDAVDKQMVTVKCDDCGYMFDSNPQDWDWEDDTNGPPFQYPPDCERCGSSETNPDT